LGHSIIDRACQTARLVIAQYMEGQTLGTAAANAWKALEGLDQLLESTRIGH